MAIDKPGDIEEVRREEQRRGRRVPIDKEKAEQRRKLQRQYRDVLREMTWEQVRGVLGLQPGTKEFDTHYQIWMAYRDDSCASERRPRGPRKP